jgi:hypothetical protein
LGFRRVDAPLAMLTMHWMPGADYGAAARLVRQVRATVDDSLFASYRQNDQDRTGSETPDCKDRH